MMTRREACKAAMGVLVGAAANGGPGLFAATSISKEHTARFWRKGKRGAVVCELCPHGCVIFDGKTGRCRNRQNIGGELVALGYARPCAVHVDPIEKKPFYHLMPGARTYSIGVAGCNLRCKNCQNYSISQRGPLDIDFIDLSPQKAVEEALRGKCPVIAFTYTEPSVWVEYMMDTAAIAKQAGLKTVMVSSGYINPTPFGELLRVLDGVRIDLKSFSEKTYSSLNAGKLQPVLDTMLLAAKEGVWLEVINLVIPGWNDSDEQIGALCGWVKEKLGADVPLHFSRFYPMYQLSNGFPTPVSTLRRAGAIASAHGLSYIYIGNVAGIGGTTHCPVCGKTVVDRSGYSVTEYRIRDDGKCGYCGAVIPGLWR